MDRVIAVIATLAETNGSPESMLYIFFNMNMDVWMRVRDVLINADLITISHYFVTLTDKGRQLADEINAKLASQASK